MAYKYKGTKNSWNRKWNKAWVNITKSEKFINTVTNKYIKLRPSLKDKRSKNITVSDKKRAMTYLKDSVRGVLEANPQMKVREVVDDVLNSRAFTTADEARISSWHKRLKEFDINIRLKSLEFDKKENKYKIIAGKYKNYYTVIVHNPGQDPSYTIELVPASQIVNFV